MSRGGRSRGCFDRPGHEPRSNRDQEFLEHARYVAALTVSEGRRAHDRLRHAAAGNGDEPRGPKVGRC